MAGGYGGKAVGEAIDPTTDARAGRAKTRTAAVARKGTRTTRTAAGTRAGATRGRTKAAATARAAGDNPRNRGPQDRARVSLSEPWEVDYWCKRLGVTPARLRQAVKQAGPMAKDVRRQLGK